MRSTILRYGGLLALFLVMVETAKRSYVTRLTDLDAYIGLVALLSLGLGVFIAYRFQQQTKNTVKSQPELQIVNRGDFSDRELDVLLFMCHGYTNAEIADQLNITQNTVKTHLKNINAKLGVNNRTQAAAEAKLLKIVA